MFMSISSYQPGKRGFGSYHASPVLQGRPVSLAVKMENEGKVQGFSNLVI